MNKEDKVISLELAKQIHEEHKRLEIKPPESAWHWYTSDGTEWSLNTSDTDYSYAETPKSMLYPAYDTAELGEMLPTALPCKESENWMGISFKGQKDDWKICYTDTYEKLIYTEMANTEAEARGKMYLWLLQNGYIIKE